MKKYIIGLFLVAFLLVPILSKAEEDIDPNPNGSECVSIVNNLKYKSRDVNTNGEVSTLQDFLQSKGYLNNEPTGYLGILTVKAVKDFQRANNINPTGYVGSVTRGKIRALTCGEIINNKDVVISSVLGPQELNINKEGTWKVSAYDKSGGDLFYSVRWGDENSIIDPPSRSIQNDTKSQTATFSHSYTQAGNYTAVFTVTNSNGQSATKSLSVKVSGITSPLLKVLSPNSQETFIRDSIQKIKWRDGITSICKNGPCNLKSQNKYYDINLIDYVPCLDNGTCKVLSRSNYLLAKAVLGFSFDWKVGDIANENINDAYIPDGSYKIQICRTDTIVCDSSDEYFKIVSSNISTPSISGVSGPQTLDINQTGTWKVSAYERNGGNLSYSVRWGDEEVPVSNIGVMYREVSQSAIFTHSYSNAGTYNPTFTVTNSNGQSATTSLSVNVN